MTFNLKKRRGHIVLHLYAIHSVNIMLFEQSLREPYVQSPSNLIGRLVMTSRQLLLIFGSKVTGFSSMQIAVIVRIVPSEPFVQWFSKWASCLWLVDDPNWFSGAKVTFVRLGWCPKDNLKAAYSDNSNQTSLVSWLWSWDDPYSFSGHRAFFTFT